MEGEVEHEAAQHPPVAISLVKFGFKSYLGIFVHYSQGLQWLDQTAVKTVWAPTRTARFGCYLTERLNTTIFWLDLPLK